MTYAKPDRRQPQDDSLNPRRRRTGRRQWCRGRVGVEHQKVWVSMDSLPNKSGYGRPGREQEICKVCQKRFTTRRRCHCGELWPDWRGCTACGYRDFYAGQWPPKPGDHPFCACGVRQGWAR